MANKTIWKSGPSQAVNFPAYLGCALFFWLLFPIFVAIWKWLEVKTTEYELTDERLIVRYGILNRHIDEVELYRIKDISIYQPLMIRFFSKSHIILKSSDVTHPTILIEAVDEADDLREKIRHLVEKCRMEKGVREID
jgi:uncharacterized membrane protein YdbT with pleckstrin-like domain